MLSGYVRILKYLILGIVFLGLKLDTYSQSINYWDNWQANINPPIWYGAFPNAINLSDGNTVICWRRDLGTIVGRLYNANLDPISDEVVLFDNLNVNFSKYNNIQSHVSDELIGLLSFNNGNFALFSHAEDALTGRIFSETMNRIAIINISTPDASPQKPKLGLLNNGNFAVTWHLAPDAGAYGAGDSRGIYCKIFSSRGVPRSDVIKVNTSDTNNELNPSITSTNNGGFIIVWQSGLRYQTEALNVFCQVFDSSGTKNGNEVLINHNSLGTQFEPNIADYKEGEKIVMCRSTSEGIVAHIINENAEFIGKELLFDDYYYRSETSITSIKLSNGNIIFAWDGYINMYDDSLNKIVTNYYLNSFKSWQMLNLKNGFLVVGQNQSNEYDITCRYLLNELQVRELDEFDVFLPENDETVTTINPIFSWKSATKEKICYPDEVVYQIVLSNDVDFSTAQTIEVKGDTLHKVYNLLSGKIYFWKVIAKNIDGDSLWSSNVNGFYIEDCATDIEKLDEDLLPTEFVVEQNYPNPFNPTTVIKYSIPVGESNYHVVIKIYDVLGRLVKELVNTNQQTGNYEVEFNASEQTSGIYFYTVQAGKFNVSKKMILMR